MKTIWHRPMFTFVEKTMLSWLLLLSFAYSLVQSQLMQSDGVVPSVNLHGGELISQSNDENKSYDSAENKSIRQEIKKKVTKKRKNKNTSLQENKKKVTKKGKSKNTKILIKLDDSISLEEMQVVFRSCQSLEVIQIEKKCSSGVHYKTEICGSGQTFTSRQNPSKLEVIYQFISKDAKIYGICQDGSVPLASCKWEVTPEKEASLKNLCNCDFECGSQICSKLEVSNTLEENYICLPVSDGKDVTHGDIIDHISSLSLNGRAQVSGEEMMKSLLSTFNTNEEHINKILKNNTSELDEAIMSLFDNSSRTDMWHPNKKLCKIRDCKYDDKDVQNLHQNLLDMAKNGNLIEDALVSLNISAAELEVVYESLTSAGNESMFTDLVGTYQTETENRFHSLSKVTAVNRAESTRGSKTLTEAVEKYELALLESDSNLEILSNPTPLLTKLRNEMYHVQGKLEKLDEDCTTSQIVCVGSEFGNLTSALNATISTLTGELNPFITTLTTMKETVTAVHNAHLLYDLVKIALTLAQEIPVVGELFIPIKAIFTVLGIPLNLLNDFLAGIKDTSLLTWPVKAAQLLNKMEEYSSEIEGLSFYIVAAGRLLETQCASHLISNVLGIAESYFNPDLGDMVIKMNAFTKSLTADLGDLVDFFGSTAWDVVNEFFQDCNEAASKLEGVLDKIKPLTNLLNEKVTIPWIGLPYSTGGDYGSPECPPSWGLSFFKGTCAEPCSIQYNSYFETVSPSLYWNCKIQCTALGANTGYNILAGCDNPQVTDRPEKDEIDGGWWHSDYCPDGYFYPHWYSSSCYGNCNDCCYHKSLGSSYKCYDYCPSYFTTTSTGEHCVREEYPEKTQDSSCSNYAEVHGGSFYQNIWGNCYKNCNPGDTNIGFGICLPPFELSFSISDIFDEIDKIMSKIENLPIIHTIYEGITNAVSFVLRPITDLFEELEKELGINIPDLITLPTITFDSPLDAFEEYIELPDFDVLSNITDLPHYIVEEIFPFSTSCGTDLTCYANELGLPENFFSVTDILSAISNLTGAIGNIILSVGDVVQCKNQASMELPMFEPLLDLFGKNNSDTCTFNSTFCVPEISSNGLENMTEVLDIFMSGLNPVLDSMREEFSEVFSSEAENDQFTRQLGKGGKAKGRKVKVQHSVLNISIKLNPFSIDGLYHSTVRHSKKRNLWWFHEYGLGLEESLVLVFSIDLTSPSKSAFAINYQPLVPDVIYKFSSTTMDPDQYENALYQYGKKNLEMFEKYQNFAFSQYCFVDEASYVDIISVPTDIERSWPSCIFKDDTYYDFRPQELKQYFEEKRYSNMTEIEVKSLASNCGSYCSQHAAILVRYTKLKADIEKGDASTFYKEYGDEDNLNRLATLPGDIFKTKKFAIDSNLGPGFKDGVPGILSKIRLFKNHLKAMKKVDLLKQIGEFVSEHVDVTVSWGPPLWSTSNITSVLSATVGAEFETILPFSAISPQFSIDYEGNAGLQLFDLSMKNIYTTYKALKENPKSALALPQPTVTLQPIVYTLTFGKAPL